LLENSYDLSVLGGKYMGTLFIVGNGLDLHFKLKTKTEHFIEHLKEQSIYNEIESAFDVLMNCYGLDWCDYEQSLNDIDLNEIEFQNEIQPDYLSDHESDRDGGIFNMQMYVNSISNAIDSALEQMVIVANDELRELSLHYHPKELFKSGDAILSFNYTSTIEYLFSIPDNVPIFHIHGCYEQRRPLIFGYRRNENSYTDNWASIEEEHWDHYIEQQREAVYEFYEGWRKKLQISDLKDFLNRCYGIDRIVVLGHSMSAVDSEYMELVEKCLNPIIWEISYYDKCDIERIQSQGYSFQNKIRFEQIEVLLEM